MQYAWYILGGCVLAVLLLLMLYGRAVRETAGLARAKAIMDELFDAILPGAEFEDAATRLLKSVSSVVEAGGYYLYVQDPHFPESLVLKASMTTASEVVVQVSYSGLFEPDEEFYEPPLSLEAAAQPRTVTLMRSSAPAILVVPLGSPGGQVEGVIRAVPVRPSRFTKAAMTALRRIQPALTKASAAVLELDRLKDESIRAARYVEASTAATTSAYHPTQLVATFAALGARLVAADSWLVHIDEQFRPRDYRPLWGGLSDSLAEEVIRGLESEAPARSGSQIMMMSREAASHSPIALLLRGSERSSAVCVPLAHDGEPMGVLVYAIRGSVAPDAQKAQALAVLADRVGASLADLRGQERLQRSYVETLRAMVMIADSQEPYTQGHSDRVARYSGLIADELRLPAREREAIRLAGYLHDVGMATLPGNLVASDRRYTRGEYDAMKTHAVIGSALVEPIFEPAPIAAMVRHHHERCDGLGYPDGLKGEAIPLGARIIAVADTFLAKVSNRSYREALPFSRALKDLEMAAGTQLDPKVVRALVRVFQRLRANPSRAGIPLEPCWETIQCPSSIRSMCPAGAGDYTCWSLRGIQCHLHGDECHRCVVFTEHEDRRGSARGAVTPR